MAHTLINAIKSYHCDMEPVVIKDFKGLKLDDPFQQMKMQTNALFFEWFMCNKVLECFNSGTRTETIQAVLIYTDMCETYKRKRNTECLIARKQIMLKQLEFKTYSKNRITGWLLLKSEKCKRAYKWWWGGLNSLGTKNGFPTSKLVFG